MSPADLVVDDDPGEYELLAAHQRSLLLEWIALVMKPAKTPHPSSTSYGMKHDFEREGFYVTNGAFKGAMRVAGYAPVNPREQNWRFRCRARERMVSRGHLRMAFTIGHATETECTLYLEMLWRVR